MTSLYDPDGALPDTLGQIQQVTESQEAVMSFFYTDQDNQVNICKIDDHLLTCNIPPGQSHGNI